MLKWMSIRKHLMAISSKTTLITEWRRLVGDHDCYRPCRHQ